MLAAADRLLLASRTGTVVASSVLVVVLGLINFAIGWEVSFSVLYLLPIASASWAGGRRAGVPLSILAATLWLAATSHGPLPPSQPWIPYWNGFVRLLFFLIVTTLLVALRDALARERELSRTDSLTGVANGRAFYEIAARESLRAQRTGRSFTLVCLDLDDFKQVNDQLGHASGDRLLTLVAAVLQDVVRRTDTVARLGGDEFALLLPETDEEGARAVIDKASAELTHAMQQAGWLVTFSAGAVVCPSIVTEIEPVLRAADELMYAVKRAGKHGAQVRLLAPDLARATY